MIYHQLTGGHILVQIHDCNLYYNTNTSDRFDKEEVYNLAECVQLPEYIFGENRIKEDRITALCMTLARLAYPTRLADYHLMFGWRPERVSRISRETQSIIYERWKH